MDGDQRCEEAGAGMQLRSLSSRLLRDGEQTGMRSVMEEWSFVMPERSSVGIGKRANTDRCSGGRLCATNSHLLIHVETFVAVQFMVQLLPINRMSIGYKLIISV